MRTLAIPAIGTGAARVVPEAAASAMASALFEHVLLGGTRIRDVRFVLYDKETRDLFIELLEDVLLGDLDQVDVGNACGHDDRAVEETVLVPLSTRGSRGDEEAG